MPIDRRSLIVSTIAATCFAGRSSATEALAELASRLASEGETCSIAVATLKGGQIAQTLFVSGCGTESGADAVFQAASLSKPLVAFLALRMVERGDLALDDPVSRFLPGGYPHRQNIFSLKATPVIDLVPVEVLRLVTPRMLLTHSAGFPNWSASGPLTPGFTPGSHWQYSGEGYVLLQHILGIISGRPLQQLAEQYLFEPMGLTNTAFRLTAAIQPRLVPGSPRQLQFPYEIAASSLYTSASDYARFVASLLNEERIMSLTIGRPVALPDSRGRILPSTNLAWGLGWGLETHGRSVSIWHWGSNPGFRSLVLADLRSRDAIVVLTASEKGMPAAKRLVNAAIPGEHPALELELLR